ncbi:Uncharacterized protein Adt_04212 [Abeliophyllum distichum]|uniref:Uncharacterized protein n=1 Tax=Abeliophyllum distichum TaxID=126358 RepID=A0ABD1W0P8_9LAMI
MEGLVPTNICNFLNKILTSLPLSQSPIRSSIVGARRQQPLQSLSLYLSPPIPRRIRNPAPRSRASLQSPPSHSKYKYELQKKKQDLQKKSLASRIDLKELKMG